MRKPTGAEDGRSGEVAGVAAEREPNDKRKREPEANAHEAFEVRTSLPFLAVREADQRRMALKHLHLTAFGAVQVWLMAA